MTNNIQCSTIMSLIKTNNIQCSKNVNYIYTTKNSYSFIPLPGYLHEDLTFLPSRAANRQIHSEYFFFTHEKYTGY
jgi:hypothetical protein